MPELSRLVMNLGLQENRKDDTIINYTHYISAPEVGPCWKEILDHGYTYSHSYADLNNEHLFFWVYTKELSQ